MYNVAYLLMSMDLPSVFKIDKIQDQSITTEYLTVYWYSHLRLAFRKPQHLAIFAKGKDASDRGEATGNNKLAQQKDKRAVQHERQHNTAMRRRQ